MKAFTKTSVERAFSFAFSKVPFFLLHLLAVSEICPIFLSPGN
jgi:hypothetical protein